MSERTQVEVFLPIQGSLTDLERRALLSKAFKMAGEVCAPGRVLGVVSVIGAVEPNSGSRALKFRFAVEAPENIQPQRKSFATR